MTDGCVRTAINHKCINITSKDEDWITQIRDLVDENKSYRKIGNAFDFTFSDPIALDWFLAYGCVPAKSKILKINKPIPEKYKWDFLRGVLDGDGCISYCSYNQKRTLKNGSINVSKYFKSSARIFSASEAFIKQISKMIPNTINFGFSSRPPKTSYYKNKKIEGTCPIHTLWINDSNCRKFLGNIYKDSYYGLRLERKYNKYLEMISK